MHKCLEITDIVCLVAAEAVSSDRPSAISLACTCRAFEDAVMEILWGAHQTDLVNLLRCFPSEVWEIQESDSSGKLYFVWDPSLSLDTPPDPPWPFCGLIGFQAAPVAFGMGRGQQIRRVDANPEHIRGLDGSEPFAKGVAGVERHRWTGSSPTKPPISRMVLDHGHVLIHQPVSIPSTEIAQRASDAERP